MNYVAIFKKRKIILLLIVFIIYGCANQKSEINLKSDAFEKFSLSETKNLENSELFLFSSNDGDFLRIGKRIVLDDNSADLLIEDSIVNIEAIYSNSFSAYPGEVSNEIVCSDEFKPEYKEYEKEGLTLRYYLLHSNDRFGIGVCDKDLIKYRQLIGWIYCQSNSELYEIKYFTSVDKPTEDLENLFLSFSC